MAKYLVITESACYIATSWSHLKEMQFPYEDEEDLEEVKERLDRSFHYFTPDWNAGVAILPIERLVPMMLEAGIPRNTPGEDVRPINTEGGTDG